MASTKRQFQANSSLLINMVGTGSGDGVVATLNAIPGESWQEKLDNVNACQCCRRHKRDRPSTFAPWKGCKSSYQQTDERCSCWCRYLARKICEQDPQTEVAKDKAAIDALGKNVEQCSIVAE